jgi:hypothetical protein
VALSLSAGVRDFHPALGFFDDLPETFGSQRLRVSVGGITASISGLSPSSKAGLAARYGIFSRGGEGAPVDLQVDLRRSPRPDFLRVGTGPELETYRLLTRLESGALLAWSYEWAACLRFERKAAILAVVSDDRVLFDRSLENFLRVAFAHLALAKGGILIHGAGVVRDGRAFVFFGPSGSGKTTATTLSSGSRVLSDDLLLITREGSKFRAASVPFRGLLAPPATSEETYPIAGMFRLVKDQADFLEDLGRPQAVGQIVQSLPFVTDRAEAGPRILDVVGDLVNDVPVKKLHFRKDPGFWRVIENVGGSAAQAS